MCSYSKGIMEIRKCKQDDKEQLAKLLKEVFPNDPPHNEPNKVLDEKLKVDDLIFVAEKRGKLIGTVMAGYDGHRGWLYSVAVSKSCRRRGVGKALVEHTISALQNMGCIKVNLQIRSTNTEVIGFYTSMGFRMEERVSMGKKLFDENT